MKTITQESKNVITSTPEVLSGETDLFFSLDEFYSAYNKPSSRNDEVVVVAEPEPPKRLAPTSAPRITYIKSSAKPSPTIEGEAQKKFGSAKAISSEQYFQDSTSDNLVSANYVSMY